MTTTKKKFKYKKQLEAENEILKKWVGNLLNVIQETNNFTPDEMDEIKIIYKNALENVSQSAIIRP